MTRNFSTPHATYDPYKTLSKFASGLRDMLLNVRKVCTEANRWSPLQGCLRSSSCAFMVGFPKYRHKANVLGQRVKTNCRASSSFRSPSYVQRTCGPGKASFDLARDEIVCSGMRLHFLIHYSLSSTVVDRTLFDVVTANSLKQSSMLSPKARFLPIEPIND